MLLSLVLRGCRTREWRFPRTGVGGSSWATQTTPAPSGGTNTELWAVSCISTPFCQAVGRYIDSGVEKVLAEEYK